MTHQFSEKEIQAQKELVFAENPALKLVAPCKLGEGILRVSDVEKSHYCNVYNQKNVPVCFFIPSSGSGSRMFQFLYEFLEKPTNENRSQVERFLNSISDFAFFTLIPEDVKKSILNQEMNLEEIAAYLLESEGLGFGQLPKGLIPFHSSDALNFNPFQEQILQGAQLENDHFSFHFTIQSSFENEIKSVIQQVEKFTGSNYQVSFSEQSIASNSIAFTEDKKCCYDSNNEIVTRPSGHGALLSNLNEVEEALIFIKNIDNVQHYKNAEETNATWKLLGGLLLDYKDAAQKVYEKPSKVALIQLNDTFQLFSEQQLNSCLTNADIQELLLRPARVCGMVKNVGQPGGGPFWVNDEGRISKQIVEKAQISLESDQYRLMAQSTHFNPVMIAASTISFLGEKFDLEKFKDSSKYFIVNKQLQGQAILFVELPGLWNGSMSNWNTIFVEIPTETFTPVKTVLDLLDGSHKSHIK